MVRGCSRIRCVAVSEAFDVVTKTQSEGTVQRFQRSGTFRDFQRLSETCFVRVICGSRFAVLF